MPQTSLACPQCRAPITANVDQIIDIGRDPAAKTRLLQGRVNVAVCPGCGFSGALAAPLVYHDPVKELLLTYVPAELRMNPADQEQILGRLTQAVVQSLAPELRKGYLLRPQTMLTMQGLIERVLESDGITREMLDAQRAKSKLTQQIVEAEGEARAALIAEHDAEIDGTVFTLLSAYGQGAAAQGDNELAEKILKAREEILRLSTAGRRIQSQKAEMEKAAQDLKKIEEQFSLDKLVQLFVSAPSLDRVSALASFTWQVLDYSFFQLLTERIEKAAGSERERLTAIRERTLEDVDRLQHAVQAEMNAAAGVLKSVLEAPDTDRAIEQYMPDFNDVFFALLEANFESARKNKQEDALKRIEDLRNRILAAMEKALPPEIRLAKDLLGKPSDAEAEAELQNRGIEVNENLVAVLKASVEDLKASQQHELAARMEKLASLAEKKISLARFGAG